MNSTEIAPVKVNKGLRKAAIFLVAVGEEAASLILQCLHQQDVERITAEISRLRNVPAEMIREVIEEFYKLWQAKDFISEGGFEYAEQVLEKALGKNNAKRILQKLGFLEGEQISGFERLDDIADEQLYNFLKNEHPQTAALILSRMDAKKSAKIIEKFSNEAQVNIVRRIATLGEVSPEFVYRVEDYLQAHFKEQFGKKAGETDGEKVVANILNMVGKGTEKSILSSIGEEDPALATEIKNLMFVFDDLVMVDDRSIQKILREIDTKLLSVALKGANDETQEKIFSNMSERAAGMLKEEIEYLGPVRLKEVEEAQRSILTIVSELEERGEIVIYREGGGDEVIS